MGTTENRFIVSISTIIIIIIIIIKQAEPQTDSPHPFCPDVPGVVLMRSVCFYDVPDVLQPPARILVRCTERWC